MALFMDNPRADPATSRQPGTVRDQELWEPTMHDVLLAQQRIAPHLEPTPLLKPAALARALGCDAYVKCENLQPVGAFKVRGGINLVAALYEQGCLGPAGLAAAAHRRRGRCAQGASGCCGRGTS